MQRLLFLPPGPAPAPPAHLWGRTSCLTLLIMRWRLEIEEPLKRTFLLNLPSPFSKLGFLPPSASLPTNKTNDFPKVWLVCVVAVPHLITGLCLGPLLLSPLPRFTSASPLTLSPSPGSLEPANTDNKNGKEGKLSLGP